MLMFEFCNPGGILLIPHLVSIQINIACRQICVLVLFKMGCLCREMVILIIRVRMFVSIKKD